MDTTRTQITRARKMGVATLVLVVLLVPLEIIAMIYPGVLPLELALLIAGLVIAVTYFYFLYGLVAIGKESGTRLAVTAQRIAFLSLVMGVLVAVTAPASFMPEIVTDIGSAVTLLSMVAFGVLSIKLAKDLTEFVPAYGTIAKRAALWNKIAGWLMVTIILSLIGALLSLIADYYLWRLEGEFLKKQPTV